MSTNEKWRRFKQFVKMPRLIVAAILLIALEPYHDRDVTACTLRWWDDGPQVCFTHSRTHGYTANFHAVPSKYGLSFGFAPDDDVFQIVYRQGGWMFVWFVGEHWLIARN